QEALALTDQQHQTTTGVVVVLVGLEVLGQVSDAVREQRDLDLRRAGVALRGPELLDDLLLGGGIEGHSSPGVVARRSDPGDPGSLDERASAPREPWASTRTPLRGAEGVGACEAGVVRRMPMKLSAADVTAWEGYQPVGPGTEGT